jgi:hypothetical protein
VADLFRQLVDGCRAHVGHDDPISVAAASVDAAPLDSSAFGQGHAAVTSEMAPTSPDTVRTMGGVNA